MRPGQPHRQLGQFPHRDLGRIADIQRPRHFVIAAHQPHQPVDQVIDVAERPCLPAVPIDGDRLAAQRLYDEIRHHPPVVWMHPRPVGVENPRHLDAHLVLAQIIEKQRLGAALALIVAGRDRAD